MGSRPTPAENTRNKEFASLHADGDDHLTPSTSPICFCGSSSNSYVVRALDPGQLEQRDQTTIVTQITVISHSRTLLTRITISVIMPSVARASHDCTC